MVDSNRLRWFRYLSMFVVNDCNGEGIGNVDVDLDDGVWMPIVYECYFEGGDWLNNYCYDIYDSDYYYSWFCCWEGTDSEAEGVEEGIDGEGDEEDDVGLLFFMLLF